MLEYAKEKPDDIEEVKFYADMQWNLKVVLNLSPVHGKSVFDFQTESGIGRLLLQLSGGNEDYKNLAIWQLMHLHYCHMYWHDYRHHWITNNFNVFDGFILSL